VKILSLLKRAINYLQNKYNIFRRLLKTSLCYRVKHKSFKMLQFALPLLDDKAVNCTSVSKFFKQLKKHITLLIYLLPCPAARVPVTSLRRCAKLL